MPSRRTDSSSRVSDSATRCPATPLGNSTGTLLVSPSPAPPGRRTGQDVTVGIPQLDRHADHPFHLGDEGRVAATVDQNLGQSLAQVHRPLPAGVGAGQPLEQVGVADGYGGVAGEGGEQLDLPVGERARPAVGGEQHPDGLVVDDQRNPEDAAQLLAAGRSVDRSAVPEAGVVQVPLAPQRLAGPEHLAPQPDVAVQLDPPQCRAHRAVDHLDPQHVLRLKQHDVRHVDGQQPPSLAGHLRQHHRRVPQGGEAAGEVVEHRELLGPLPALVQQLAELAYPLRFGDLVVRHRGQPTNRPACREASSPEDLRV